MSTTSCWGDKSNAWNVYLHDLAPVARTYVFVDGYARIDATAIHSLMATLAADPAALGASGVPRSGRSARRTAAVMQTEGGLHGNLYALTRPSLLALRTMGWRLPLGLYRSDAVIGAALAWGLDAVPRDWQPRTRIALAPAAGWSIPTLRWWHPADWRTHQRRLTRQRQGRLENAAVRDLYAVRRAPLNALPATVQELVGQWRQRAPDAAAALLRQRGMARAADRLAAPHDWSASKLATRTLLDTTSVAAQARH